MTLRAALLSSVLLALTPAAAGDPFDGRWTVDVIVQQGACEEGLSVPLRVAGGRISYDGQIGLDASGSVAADGHVVARFSRRGESLHAQGRLSPAGGSGTWSAPSRDCAGRWQARRA